MNSKLKLLLTEPFFHFLLLGGLLYLFYNFTQEDTPSNKKSINISAYEIDQLKISYKNSYNREANKIELAYLIQSKLYEKILLKEAESLKLDKRDDVIVKKIIDKMHFIMSGESSALEPTEDELFDFYKQNIKDYSKIKTLSFNHIFLNTNKIEKAQKLLKFIKIAHVKAEDAHNFSDSLDDIDGHSSYKNIDYKTINRKYGNYFTNKIFQLRSHTWSQPIHSKYGLHLIYITDKNVADSYSFDEVQDRVYRDYLLQRKEASIKKAYEKFSLQYQLNRSK